MRALSIYFIRHGLAAERGAAWPDDTKRPLIPRGVARLRKEAAALRALGIGFDAQLRTQCCDPGDDAEPFQQFAFVLGVGSDDAGDVADHLLHESPCLGRLGGLGGVIRHDETTISTERAAWRDSAI